MFDTARKLLLSASMRDRPASLSDRRRSRPEVRGQRPFRLPRFVSRKTLPKGFRSMVRTVAEIRHVAGEPQGRTKSAVIGPWPFHR